MARAELEPPLLARHDQHGGQSAVSRQSGSQICQSVRQSIHRVWTFAHAPNQTRRDLEPPKLSCHVDGSGTGVDVGATDGDNRHHGSSD